jgi:hypothetical protein
MGVRETKGRALARYILGTTGVPFIRWESNGIQAPAPYGINITTSRALQNWHDTIRELPVDKPHMAIRYDNSLPDVSHAWVAMKLGAFTPLMEAHYNTIRDRIEKE